MGIATLEDIISTGHFTRCFASDVSKAVAAESWGSSSFFDNKQRYSVAHWKIMGLDSAGTEESFIFTIKPILLASENHH